MKVAISLKSVADLSLPSSPSPAVPLNRPILARSKWLTRHIFSFTLWALWCVGNPGAGTVLTCMWETGTAGDQVPNCHPGRSRLVPNGAARDLGTSCCCCKSCPTASAPRRTCSSLLVPISSPPAAASASLVLPVQHWGFSHPQQCGSTHATAKKQEMQASEGRQSRVCGLLSLLPACSNCLFV